MGEFILNGRNYGGSIITPNPSDTPTDTLDSIKIDDTTYEIQGNGGGETTILADSAIDESRLLFTSGEITKFNQTPVTYTATEDCYALCIYKGSSGTNMRPIINEVAVDMSTLDDMIGAVLPLKKGDTIRNRYDSVSENCYFKMRIYGRKPASIISAPVIYSDEERLIGVWRDDKPLYQKTIDIGTLPNAGQKLVNHNISDFGEAVRVFGYARNTSNNAIIPLPHNHPNAANQSVSLIVTTTQISVQTGVDRSGYVGCVTVQYTKASDTAGSGEYNTLAIPNVHYSTDEQVIGTWIDGKTLYQITKKIVNDELWADLTYYGLGVTDLDFVAVKEATFVDPSNSVYASLPYRIPSTNNYIEVGINIIDSIKRLTIRTNTTFSATTGRYIVATIIYTKTTD